MEDDSRLILCPICKGEGTHYILKTEYLYDHYREDYEKEEECPICEGHGRVIEIITVTYKPYPTKKIKYEGWIPK